MNYKFFTYLLFIFVLFGCQNIKKIEELEALTIKTDVWKGRLSVITYNEFNKIKDSANLSFVLLGNENQGNLKLSSNFGIQVANLEWNEFEAKFTKGSKTIYEESLQNLINKIFQEEIPVFALFSWLKGENLQIPDWEVLSEKKIIQAKKLTIPKAQIKILLNK